MVKKELVSEILSLYKKHGWGLRRVLLSDNLRKELSVSLESLFGAAEISSSEVDAAWFSRDSNKTNTAWELRHLSENPFAVFEVFDKGTDAETLSENLSGMEERLKNRLINSR